MLSSQRYILSVFQSSGLCSPSSARQLAETSRTTVESILGNWGIRVTDWVPVQEADCFATLAYAEVQAARSQALNLLELRRELTRSLAAQELQVRIQREDVFSAMHRL